jgi:hypothetical protein
MQLSHHQDLTVKRSPSPSISKRRPFLLLAWTSLLISASGCALIIGTEERTEETVEGGTRDSSTEIVTTGLCIEYCNEVMGNCTSGNAVYASRASCINTCNALPPGEAAEPSGNSVQCRLRRARGAASAPDEECVAAGPGGDASCGSNCETWCHLMESQCPNDYEILADCEKTCEGIPDAGGFDVDGSYERDDIQCRLIHLGAVAGDPESAHCGHARYIAAEKCIPGADEEPSCAVYCDTVMANCRGADAAYEDRDDCLATCAQLPLGTLSDRTQNSVGCRIYHGRSSSQDPSSHCNHAGPTGDGHCGFLGDGENTGNCESYCRLFQAACSEEFDGEGYGDLGECVQACQVGFEDKGAGNDTLYDVDTAREDDSLQCRVYYATRALGGAGSACAKVSPSSPCD